MVAIYSFLMPTCAQPFMHAGGQGTLRESYYHSMAPLKTPMRLPARVGGCMVCRLVSSRTSTGQLLILRLIVHPLIWDTLTLLFSNAVRHIGEL